MYIKQIAIAALLVNISFSLSSCGKKSKDDAGKSAQQVPPSTLNLEDWPLIEIEDRENLNEKIKDKKVTISFKVTGKVEGIEILCRHGKQKNIQDVQLKPCVDSYIADAIENGQTYAFEIHGKNTKSGKQKHLDAVFLGTANPETPIIVVEGEELLKKTFIGPINL